MTKRQLESHSEQRQAAVNATGAKLDLVHAIDEDPTTITVHVRGKGPIDVSKATGKVVAATPEPEPAPEKPAPEPKAKK